MTEQTIKTQEDKKKPVDLSQSDVKDWVEISRFGIIGFFVGSIVWIFGLGLHQLILLFATLVRAFLIGVGDWLPNSMMNAEQFANYQQSIMLGQESFFNAMQSIVNVWDASGLLIPILGAILLFWWRYRFTGERGVWMTTTRSLFRNRSAIIGIVIIGLFSLIANYADLLSPYDPIETLVGRPRTAPCVNVEALAPLGIYDCESPPEQQFIFGTDLNGRDLLSRVIWGTRISIPIGLIAVSISIFFGTLIGLIAGYYGGWVDNVIMRLMDVMLAFPSLLLAIAIVTVLGPGLQNALIAISIVATPSYARLMRSSVLTLKEQEFILAVRALGAKNNRIMFKQILPNALTPIVVQGTLGIGTAVLDAAALSFLGLGAQPPAAEWGQMLGESFNFFLAAPYLVIYPGVCIMLTVLGFNLLGDGLRDALDPRLNKS